jgi:restriction system protein
METRRIWAVRGGNFGQADHVFLDLNQIAISFAEAGGDVSQLPANRSAFKQAMEQSLVPMTAAGPTQANQLFRFVHEMRIGDFVIYPRKVDRTLRWGEVAGPYVFDRDRSAEFAHRRSVNWLGRLSRDAFSQGALYEVGSVLTLFEVKSFADEFLRKFSSAYVNGGLLAIEEDGDDTIVRDIAETTRDFVSRRLRTDFKGYPLEPFVADLFSAMGYRSHATRGVRDDGIDVIAHRDELGIEPPILKIQVKAQENNIAADVVKAFYAMVEDRDVGIFITTGGYTQAASEFARTKGNLKLVDGVTFIDLIQRHYDRLDPKHRQQIPLRRVLVPDLAPVDP